MTCPAAFLHIDLILNRSEDICLIDRGEQVITAGTEAPGTAGYYHLKTARLERNSPATHGNLGPCDIVPGHTSQYRVGGGRTWVLSRRCRAPCPFGKKKRLTLERRKPHLMYKTDLVFKILKNAHFLQRLFIKCVARTPWIVDFTLEKIAAFKKIFNFVNVESVAGDYVEFGVFEGTSLITAFECHICTKQVANPQRKF